ncbi:MAG: NB-ARC domain-containing protein [Actinomycetota bacterium]|nr:NB-ARC domain-containing protein [Actinomycetota bacterium]
MPRSFVSAAKDAVARAGHIPFEQRFITAADLPPMQLCKDEVAASDVYVGLIGFQYGTPVRERPDVSYTELEYETAKQQRIRRLVFLLDESASDLPGSVFMDADHASRQTAFRQRLESDGIVVARFRTPDELELQLYSALTASPQHGAAAATVPFMAPPLPVSFVPRQSLAQGILPLLLTDDVSRVGITTALRGAGGFGKTTMAAWLCHQPDVREKFPDGVLWVKVGADRTPLDLIGLISDLCFRLSGERPGFHDPHMAGGYLGELLGERRILMVVDDIWNPRDVEPFLLGGSRCLRLITTRSIGVLPDGTPEVRVDAMSDTETLALLQMGLPEDPRADFSELIRCSGGWALLLKLMNGALRAEMRAGATLPDAIATLTDGVRAGGPAALNVESEAERDRAVTATVEVGLDALARSDGQPALDRYLDLAVFAEDADIPLDALEHYWVGTEGRFKVRQQVLRFFDQSLIERFDANASTLRLSPVMRSYLQHRCRDGLPRMHERLLDVYRPQLSDGSRAWFSMRHESRYMWANLAYHLIGAGQPHELMETVTDLRFLVTKTFLLGPGAVEADFVDAQHDYPPDERARALQAQMRLSAHQLTGFDRLTDLAATIRVRVQVLEPLVASLSQLEEILVPPYLRMAWCHADAAHSSPLGSHRGSVHSVESDALGTRVVSGGDDGAVRVWDVQSGRELRQVGGPFAVKAVRIDPTGRRIVTGCSDGTVRMWDAASGDELGRLEGHGGARDFQRPVNSVGVDRYGATVVSGGADGTVRIWDASTGEELRRMDDHGTFVNSVRINPAGTRVVSGGADGTVRVWDAATGKQLQRMEGHGGTWDDERPVNSVGVDRSGQRIVSGGADGTVRIWDAESGEELVQANAHAGQVNSVAFDGSGTQVVSGGADGLVRVWGVKTGALLATSEHCGSLVTAVAFDDSGSKVVLGAADGTVRMYVPVAGASLPAHEDKGQVVKALSFDAQARRLASGGSDGRVRLWDVETGQHIVDLVGHLGGVNSVDFDASGDRLVSGGADGAVRISDTHTGAERLALGQHGRWVNSVRFDGSGDRVVSGGADGTIRIHDAATGGEMVVLTGHGAGAAGPVFVNSVSFDASGERVVSAGADGTVRLWDAGTGEELHRLTGHPTFVNSVAFDPTGKRVISAGWDGSIRIWSADSGEPSGLLESPTWVTSVRFDSSGTRIMSGGGDGVVRIWDVETGKQLTMLVFDGSVFTCCWGPGREVAVGSGHGLHLLNLVDR